MGDITHLPTGHCLANVPHMLRYWADMVERDAAHGVELEFAAVILTQRGDPTPAFFIADRAPDQPPHPLYAAGILDYCRWQMLNAAKAASSEA